MRRRAVPSWFFPPALALLACAGQSPNRPAEALSGRKPEPCGGSLQELSRCLSAGASSERDKAWAIYRWIALNITYDLKAAQGGAEASSAPDEVLQSHTAVCEGFSDLFVELARAAGLEAVRVPGHAKGLGYEAGDSFQGKPANHAWNAVRIDGKWCLLDCTWGSGAVDADGQYRKRFEPYYFCSPPEELLQTHFPLDPRWQLVAREISLADFEKFPYVKPAFFRCGLKTLSHAECIIEAPGRSLSIELGVPEDVVIVAKLGACGASRNLAQVVEGKRRRGSEIFHFVLPASGDYLFRVFTTRSPGLYGGRRTLDWALDYKIVAR